MIAGRKTCWNYSLECCLEGIIGMSVFGIQWPGELLVESLQVLVLLFGNSRHDRMDSLGLVIALFTLDDIRRWNTTFRQINISYWCKTACHTLERWTEMLEKKSSNNRGECIQVSSSMGYKMNILLYIICPGIISLLCCSQAMTSLNCLMSSYACMFLNKHPVNLNRCICS